MPARLLRSALAAALALGALAVAPPAVQAEPDLPYFDELTGADLAVNGTYSPLVGHFSDEVWDDILWYAPGAATDYRWTPCPGCDGGRFASTRLEPQVGGRYQPLVGDFAGDDLDDVFWWNNDVTAPQASYLWTNDGDGTFTSKRLDVGRGDWEAVVLHDSQAGGGKDDILWRSYYRSSLVWIFPDDGSGAGRTRARPWLPAGRAMTGDFDGNGVTDVFFYWGLTGCTCPEIGPALRPDSLWRRSTSEASTFSVMPANVKGQYDPIAGRFSAADDPRSDLLWVGAIAPGRGGAADGPDAFWEGTSAGWFAGSDVSIPLVSFPLVLTRDGPDVVWLPGAAAVWFDTPDGPVWRETGETEHLYGPPLIGRFTAADRDSVFVYQPGPDPEHILEPVA